MKALENETKWVLGIRNVVTAAILLLFVSCNNEKIEVYRIPKASVSMEAGALVPAPPANRPKWSKPATWEEQPLAEMRLGSFKVAGENGSSADVSIIEFPGEAGGLMPNVNRWRGQVQLQPLGAEELNQTIQKIDLAGIPVSLVDLSTPPTVAKPSRILGAVLERPDRTWFVKMTGPPDLLEKERAAFLDFVKSFRFDSSAADPVSAPPKQRSTNDQ
jgi:hypothetical protein